jgi:thymidylate synthase (FAD)
MINYIHDGIEYTEPSVTLISNSGIGISEFAARTCYDSFDKSEHNSIKNLDTMLSNDIELDHLDETLVDIKNIKDSDLLDKLAWTHFHYSILEHTSLSFSIKNMSRGVLQELARHRLASYSVRSTRYTMSALLNIFISVLHKIDSDIQEEKFIELSKDLHLLVVKSEAERIELKQIWEKLSSQANILGIDSITEKIIPKKLLEEFLSTPDLSSSISLLNTIAKRNVGDSFKWIVTDNWSCDLVFTINIRSLKNFLELRLSGAAFFQIQKLAHLVALQTPKEALSLIMKSDKISKL